MKVLTIKSTGTLSEDLQTEVHYRFGMEQTTDYVFTPRGDSQYSATIVIEDTKPVIERIIEATKGFKDLSFVIDDLDMDRNTIERYHVREGLVKERLRSGWKWD